MTLTNHKPFHSAQGLLRQLLALNLVGFVAGICLLGTNNQLDHIFGLGLFNFVLSVCKFFLILLGGSLPSFHSSAFPGMQVVLVVLYLDLVLFPSEPITSLPIPGSSFILTVLIFLGGGMVAVYVLATADVVDKELAEVSGEWFAIGALTTLWAAGIAGIAQGFGGALHTDFINSSLGLHVTLVFMGLDVGSRAFCRLLMVLLLCDELHLDLVLLPSDPITSLPTSGSIFTDCQPFLMLILLGGMVAVYVLATADVVDTDRTEVSEWLIAICTILVLTNLCTAVIAAGFGVSLCRLTTCLPGMQVVLIMSLVVGSRAFSFVMAEVIGYLGLLSSPRITSLLTPGSSCIFTDCKFLLIITIVLMFIGRMLIAYRFATSAVLELTTDLFTKVSGCSSSIVVLKNLWVAGIDAGFGVSLCRLTTCLPGMQVVLVMVLGIWTWFFTPELSAHILHDSGGFRFIISGLCRNKFDNNFSSGSGSDRKRSLGLRLFRLDIIGLEPISIGYVPFILRLNCF